jgi:hypothetical protein
MHTMRVPRFVAGLLLLAARALGQPLGSEFQANTYINGTQGEAALAADGTGRFVVIWRSNQAPDPVGVFGQRFDAAGVPLGSEFHVNTYTTSHQALPAVASDPAGNFLVTWSSGFDSDQDGDDWGVFAQRFDASGTPLGGEFQVNTYTTGRQWRPAVAADAAGNFVVTWDSCCGQDGDSSGVFARRFDAAGIPLGLEFAVNTYTTAGQDDPAVAADPMGGFVVAWAGSPGDVFARRFDSTGTPLGAEVQVNTYTSGSQFRPSVASDSAGNFLVVWESVNGQDGDSSGVFGQRYASTGAPLGPEFRANTSTADRESDPTVACDGGGSCIVAWTNEVVGSQGGFANDVFAQRYDATGSPIGGEFQVNTYTAVQQFPAPAAAADGTGTFVVVWNGSGVLGKRLSTELRASGKIRLRDNPDVTKRKLTASFDFGEAAALSLPDFDPAANGAFLHVFNPATGLDSACIDLPAGGWTTVDAAASNFLYRDPTYASGPCKLVVVTRGRYARLLCTGKVQPLSYSLDEPAQQAIDVRIGSGAIEHCTEFGSRIAKDVVGTFSARRAVPPLTCGRVALACP